MNTDCVLTVRYTPVSKHVIRAAQAFALYMQHRNQPADAQLPDAESLINYMQHRDSTAPEGRLFNEAGLAGDEERQDLINYIGRSLTGPGRANTHGRAFYRLIISPSDARNVDLRAVTSAVMSQLEKDAGSGGLPPWVAAEHRNTEHPHVHVLLAARRQLESGQFRTLVITRERLQRLHLAKTQELIRQRDARQRRLERRRNTMQRLFDTPNTRLQLRPGQPGAERSDTHLSLGHRRTSRNLARAFGRIGWRYQREAERLARQRALSEDDARRRTLRHGMAA
jgi:hypothetical protein